jgi:uncharacterized membrane protein YoaK (UPF0700 family)
VAAQFTIVTGIYAASMQVLGPLTAHAQLGGARSWGLITAAYAVGAVAGGLVMTRYRPDRLLVAGMLSIPAYSLLLFALAVPCRFRWISARPWQPTAARKCSPSAGRPRCSRRYRQTSYPASRPATRSKASP